jgi:hypothetical protein
LKRGRYRKQRVVAGWVRSPGTGIEMHVTKRNKLAIRLASDDATREDLPDD